MQKHLKAGNNFKESVWCEFSTANKEKVLVGCIDRSPSSDEINNQALYDLLATDEFLRMILFI